MRRKSEPLIDKIIFTPLEHPMKSFLAGIVLLAGIFTFTTFVPSPVYSDGQRIGVIQKFGRKGIFCKSAEGELVMTGAKPRIHNRENAVTASYNNVWEFSARDDAIVTQLEEAMNSGQPVVLHYAQLMWTGLCSVKTDYTITKVIPVK